MTATHATMQEIASQAHTSVGHARQATRILRDAPDLAAQVEHGQFNITDAFRLLIARNLQSRGPGRI